MAFSYGLLASTAMLVCLQYVQALPAPEEFAGNQPNPPNWPPSVFVADGTNDVQGAVNSAFNSNGGASTHDSTIPITSNVILRQTTPHTVYTLSGHDPSNHGQFSTNRYAFLFKPGQYDIDVPVGYYTSIHGLGEVVETLLTPILGPHM